MAVLLPPVEFADSAEFPNAEFALPLELVASAKTPAAVLPPPLDAPATSLSKASAPIALFPQSSLGTVSTTPWAAARCDTPPRVASAQIITKGALPDCFMVHFL